MPTTEDTPGQGFVVPAVHWMTQTRAAIAKAEGRRDCHIEETRRPMDP